MENQNQVPPQAQPVIDNNMPQMPNDSDKNPKTLMIAISTVVIILIIGGLVWYLTKNKATEQTYQPTNLINNQPQTSMSTIDPKAQAFVDQFNELTKKLSDNARHGNPSDADMQIIDQMQQISGELAKYDTNRIDASINIDAYGYDVSIALNGKDMGIAGNKSTSMRLFNDDSIMALISTQDVKYHNFILNSGENTIVITYKKIKDSSFGLTLNLLAYDNVKVLSVEAKNKAEGKIEKTFILEPQRPSDFQTITVSE